MTEQASARLQFARFAFGAAGSAGSVIDLGTAEQISRGFIGKGKHRLIWNLPAGQMAKDQVKLLLNLIASAVTALPRGGDIEVSMLGALDAPQAFVIVCRGAGAREPLHLADFIRGGPMPRLDAMTIQAYYTWRLAEAAGMLLDIRNEGQMIVLVARPKPSSRK